jgi:2-polyprenyl-6-methoxyphenol hydroxylase-like FAD-dependent oxidoreductase
MGQIHLSHRFVSYEEHEREVLLRFENGTTTKCDVLIGADGIRSAVRRCFLDSQGLKNSPSHKPYWSGAYAYRGLVRLEDLHKEFPGHRVSDQAMMVSEHFSSANLFQSHCYVTVLREIQGLEHITLKLFRSNCSQSTAYYCVSCFA